MEITAKIPQRTVKGLVLGCKQHDLVSRQGKKYPRLKRAVIVGRSEWAVLSRPLPCQVLHQPECSAQDLASILACALPSAFGVFPSPPVLSS